MPGPSQAWQSIAASEVDQDSPITTTLLEKYRTNQIHLKEVLYGTGSYRGETPHRHAGIEDASLADVMSENLLSDSCPTSGTGVMRWSMNGWTAGNNGFDVTTTSGHYAAQTLYGQGGQSRAAFGTSGADIVIGLYVKAQGTLPSAGELWFGLADGTTFFSGCKATVAHGSITSSWKRFYVTLSAKGGGAASSVTVLIKNGTTAPNQKLYVSGVTANLGASLTYWSPGINEPTSTHDDWKKYSIGPPVWEKATSITNATLLAGA